MAYLPAAPIHLFIGQSNAYSWETSGVAYPGGWTTDTVWGGLSEVIWDPVLGQWVEYVPGTSRDGGGSQRWGAEASYSFQRRSLNPRQPTYLFKYPVGNTGMARKSDATNDWSAFSDGKAFATCMDELAEARAALEPYRNTYIDTCVYIGNETDTVLDADAQQIEGELPYFIETLRTYTRSPDMKFVIVRTPAAISGSFPNPVRGAQVSAGTHYRNAWVDADGLTYSAGHYTPTSVVTLGQRIFTARQGIVY